MVAGRGPQGCPSRCRGAATSSLAGHGDAPGIAHAGGNGWQRPAAGRAPGPWRVTNELQPHADAPSPADSPARYPCSGYKEGRGSPKLPSWLLEGRFFLRLPVPFDVRPWALGRVPEPDESVTASSEKDLSREVSRAESGAVRSSSSSPSPPRPAAGRPAPRPWAPASSAPSRVVSASAWRVPGGAVGSSVSWLKPIAVEGLSLEKLRGFRA